MPTALETGNLLNPLEKVLRVKSRQDLERGEFLPMLIIMSEPSQNILKTRGKPELSLNIVKYPEVRISIILYRNQSPQIQRENSKPPLLRKIVVLLPHPELNLLKVPMSPMAINLRMSLMEKILNRVVPSFLLLLLLQT